jgi:hypothetical protein
LPMVRPVLHGNLSKAFGATAGAMEIGSKLP